MRPLNILTWHKHGSYLPTLLKVPHRFHVIAPHGPAAAHGGSCATVPKAANVVALPAAQAHELQFDCIVFQDVSQYEKDQYACLSASQRALPRIYLEHEPPLAHPVDAPHPVDDPDILLVHVSHFNALMWDCGRTPTRVIEHGVVDTAGQAYRGTLERGLVVMDHLARHGRALGPDIFARVRAALPLDLVGAGADELGGIGELTQARLPAFAADYRFFFRPQRYAGGELTLIEAMMIGMPVVALATTDMAGTIDNGMSGYVDTDIDALIYSMKELLRQPALARKLGQQARRHALERFGIARFVADWDAALRHVTGSAVRKAVHACL
jgi:hypothetical protein